jgi:ribonuclease Z
LICEATFLANSENGRTLAEEHLHMTSEQAATVAKESASKKLILTHISQRYENKSSELLKEAKKIFKNTTLANDFDKLSL